MKLYSVLGRAILAASVALSGSVALAQSQNDLAASLQQSIKEKEAAIVLRNSEISRLEKQTEKVLADAGITPDVMITGGILGVFGSFAGGMRAAMKGRPDLQAVLKIYLDMVETGNEPAPLPQATTGQVVKRVAPWIVLVGVFGASAIYGNHIKAQVDEQVKSLSGRILALQRANEVDAGALKTLTSILNK